MRIQYLFDSKDEGIAFCERERLSCFTSSEFPGYQDSPGRIESSKFSVTGAIAPGLVIQ